MAEILGYPLGLCNTHGPLLSVNGVPRCLRCENRANRPVDAPVVKVEDPGEAFFGGKEAAQYVPNKTVLMPKNVTNQYTIESGLNEILNVLSLIPMPSSMKQYKLLMNVKQKIESALQEG